MKVKCNKCGYIGEKSEFPIGNDFFQQSYIKACPQKCGNTQNPSDAAFRMFGGKRPFEFIKNSEPMQDALGAVLDRASEAS
jgi:hypothetical protein